MIPYAQYKPQHSCGTIVSTLLWHNLGAFLVASNCDTALAIHLALLNKLLAGLLLAQANHICLGFNASHSTHDVISQLFEQTPL
jgi:hypothetical protein